MSNVYSCSRCTLRSAINAVYAICSRHDIPAIFCPSFPQTVENRDSHSVSSARTPSSVCLYSGTCGACCHSSSRENSLVLMWRRGQFNSLGVQTLSQGHQPCASLRPSELEKNTVPNELRAFAEDDAGRTWASLPPRGTWRNLFTFPLKSKCIGQEFVDTCRPQGRSLRLDMRACRR